MGDKLRALLAWFKRNVDWIGFAATAAMTVAVCLIWPSISLASALAGCAAWGGIKWGLARAGHGTKDRWRTEASCLAGAVITFLLARAVL